MYAIGIDPSCTKTGLVILPPEGNEPLLAMTVCPDEKFKTPLSRSLDIEAALVGAITETVNGNPLIIAIEGFSYNSKFRGVDQAIIGTALRMAIIRMHWRYVEPAPTQVKKYAGVKGKTKPKKEVQFLWGFKPKNVDIADAYVMAQIARGMSNRKGLNADQQDVLMSCRYGLSLASNGYAEAA